MEKCLVYTGDKKSNERERERGKFDLVCNDVMIQTNHEVLCHVKRERV